MSFGSQSVTLRAVGLGTAGAKGIRQSVTVSSSVVSGCLFRPVSSKEQAGGNTDEITKVFKITMPPTAAALAVDETYEVDYVGAPFTGTYVVFEARHYPDLSGRIDHVTLWCRRWIA